jgi:ferredoxin
MKIAIDKELCSGHGRCYTVAGDVYRPDIEGFNADRGSVIDVPAGHEAAAMLGLKSCPEAAISLVESDD